MKIPVENIETKSLDETPIWEYDDEDGAVCAAPTGQQTTADLRSKLLALRVVLANGDKRWALISNLSTDNELCNHHFVTLAVDIGGSWFPLARYHDVDWDTHGPGALAAALALRVDEVFPLRYDASSFVVGAKAPMSGVVEAEPAVRLSRQELIRLAVNANKPH